MDNSIRNTQIETQNTKNGTEEIPALDVLNSLPVILDLALRLGQDLLQLVHLALQLRLQGKLHVVEGEGATGELVPTDSTFS